LRNAAIDELALPPLGIGEWVVLVVQARNWSDQDAVLDMSQFALVAGGPTGAPVPLDPGSGDLARFLGFSPAYDSDDAVLFAPGESHRLALLFQVSAEANDLTLVAGDGSISLDEAFAASADITALGDSPVVPELVSAEVTRVIDGRTIEVDLNGVLTEIAYLGIDVPTGEECGAAESTALNNTLVVGRTVWLERERRNTDAQQRLLRDVWLVNSDGSHVLVAAVLVAEGVAVPAPVEPDVRYAGWLRAAAATARAEGAGQWGACAT
jgi:endonuclease YncB( thermonuclease family)